MSDPHRIVIDLALLPPGLGRMAYSCTHMTIAPTMLQAGSKVNIIPETVEIQLDVRTLPGDGARSAR